MISHKSYHIFITPIESPWWELSNGILVDIWVQKLTPNQPISHRDPLIAISISFFCVPHKNLRVPSANPPPVLKPYNYFVHGLNSLFVWLQHRVWLADGIVSWQHNTMSDRRQEGWIGGGYFHLRQAPLGTAVAKNIVCMHHLDLVLQ